MRQPFYQLYFFFSLFLLYIYLPYIIGDVVYYSGIHLNLPDTIIHPLSFRVFYFIKMLFIDVLFFAFIVRNIYRDLAAGITVSNANYFSLLLTFSVHFFPFFDRTRQLFYAIAYHSAISDIFTFPTLTFYFTDAVVAVVCVLAFMRLVRGRK